jgi:hypothetical protein
MEVVNSLNTLNTPCNENVTKDDEILNKNLIGTSECQFAHTTNQKSLKKCSTQKQFQDFYIADQILRKSSYQYIPPCRMLTSLDFDYTESNATNPKHTEERPKHKFKSFNIRVAYSDLTAFKEIRRRQGHITSLIIKSVGVFGGLVIGLTVWKMLDCILFFIDFTGDLFSKRKPLVNVNINNKIISTRQK